MKFYDVECPIHGKFEISQNLDDTTSGCPRLCPITEKGEPCGQPLTRKYNSHPVHFKGTGFYKTDHK